MRIRDPRWSKGAWVGPGGEFSVIVEGGGDVEGVWIEKCSAVTLGRVRRSDRARASVEKCSAVALGRHVARSPSAERRGDRAPWSVERERDRGGSFREITVRAPEGIGDGVYDLRVRCGGEDLREPHCVAVRRVFEDPFTFVHTSDLHLLKGMGEAAKAESCAAARDVVRRINAAGPAFVVDTGDLINRYDRNKDKMPDEIIRWQLERAREILLELRSPVYLCPGNHDLAFAACREAWARLMGRPWDRDTDDYGFDFGAYHFAVLDGFGYCDEVTWAKTEHAFTPGQIEWLRADLAASAGSRLRVLFSHYDYHSQMAGALETLNVDLFLYGHSGPREGCVGRSGVNGHLPAAEQFACFRIDRGRVVRV